MASKDSKRKYDNEEDRVSTATSKGRRPFDDDSNDDSSSEEVSSKDESARPPHSDDVDTTN
jgi:hypothetical protein